MLLTSVLSATNVVATNEQSLEIAPQTDKQQFAQKQRPSLGQVA
jgi:hypothetical protein